MTHPVRYCTRCAERAAENAASPALPAIGALVVCTDKTGLQWFACYRPECRRDAVDIEPIEEFFARLERPVSAATDAQLPVRACACGWKRPLIAITDANGEPPAGPLRVFYACPECGATYQAGEVPAVEAKISLRALDLARRARFS